MDQIPLNRRKFLRSSGSYGTGLALAGGGLLHHLPSVTAAEGDLAPHRVSLHPDIEPLVRWIELAPRDQLLEQAADRIRRGQLNYQQLVAALMLAGVRNIQPRPVGFKFHAVLVVNSAHLASLASPAQDRWLPIFWALDYFKDSQARDEREGDWTMAELSPASLPPAHKARAAFVEAMDSWDEPAADRAVAALAQSASANELFDLFAYYGCRDFRDIGHKAIYVANAFRTLEAIGWHHAGPILRSLAYALLDRGGDRQNPADADLAADRPYRDNLLRVKEIPDRWLEGSPDDAAMLDLLRSVRARGGAEDSSALAFDLLRRGVSPRSVLDACFMSAAELVLQEPAIISLHAMTFTNAIQYCWNRCQDVNTRRLLLLQNAAFLPLFASRVQNNDLHIDSLEPISPDAKDPSEAISEIFSGLRADRATASRKLLGHLETHPDPSAFANAARRLIFLKGRNSHDYKFSSAILEDHTSLPHPWRARLLAGSLSLLRGEADSDTGLAPRVEAAFRS